MTITNTATRSRRMRSKKHAQACPYFALVRVGEATYFYHVQPKPRSHWHAYDLVMAAHTELRLGTPDVCLVIGPCPKRYCRSARKLLVMAHVRSSPRVIGTNEYLISQTQNRECGGYPPFGPVVVRIDRLLQNLASGKQQVGPVKSAAAQFLNYLNT